MTRCAAKYPPFLNHALVFTTDEKSLHGFPDPDLSGRAVAQESGFVLLHGRRNDQFTAHSTDYFARPEDGWGKSAMIWLDKKAVDLYSRAKARFGFSDKLASKILRFLSRKK